MPYACSADVCKISLYTLPIPWLQLVRNTHCHGRHVETCDRAHRRRSTEPGRNRTIYSTHAISCGKRLSSLLSGPLGECKGRDPKSCQAVPERSQQSFNHRPWSNDHCTSSYLYSPVYTNKEALGIEKSATPSQARSIHVRCYRCYC